MPVGFTWGKGVHEELRAIEEIFNHADPSDNKGFGQALEDFRDAMNASLQSDGALGLMDGVAGLLSFVNSERSASGQGPITVMIRPNRSQNMVPVELNGAMLEAIHKDWFSDRCMWRFDAVLSPAQMHEIMRRTGAEMAERRLTGAGPVEMNAQCEHDRMQVRFASAPTAGDGRFRVWIYTPANAGWLPPERALADESIRAELLRIANEYQDLDIDDTTRDQLLTDVVSVVSRASMEYLPFNADGVPFFRGGRYSPSAPGAGSAESTPVDGSVREPGASQPPSEAQAPNGEWHGGDLVGWVE